MIDPPGCVRLPFTPDLTQAGITYACRHLPHLYLTQRDTSWKTLQNITLKTALELALHRYLIEQDIPIQRSQTTPFTEPERTDLFIGGRRCEIQSTLICSKEKIRRFKKAPARLLDETIPIQRTELLSDYYQNHDLHILTIATALIAPHQPKINQAIQAGQPASLIFLLSRRWNDCELWKPFNRLAFSYTGSTPINIEVGGQGQDNRFDTQRLHLIPSQTTQLNRSFSSIFYLHPEVLPNGSLTIFNQEKQRKFHIGLEKWLNIWIYGIEIIFVGYCTHIELIQKAYQNSVGAYPVRFPKDYPGDFRLPVRESNPFVKLVNWIKTWQS
jgi:hypothetical protein